MPKTSKVKKKASKSKIATKTKSVNSAKKNEIECMKKNYELGGYGYGHAKNELFELILKKYSVERDKFQHYISNPDEVEKILKAGAIKANATANKVLNRVRKKLGY